MNGAGPGDQSLGSGGNSGGNTLTYTSVAAGVDGRIETVVRSRRDGPAYRDARDLEWGDALGAAVLDPG